MFLANCNIQELVTKQVKLFLQNEELSYSEIKALILSKAPIPKIQSAIISAFNQSKESDLKSVKKKLEEQAYKTQLQEDKKQKEKDKVEEEKDNNQKEHLKRLLRNIPSELSEHESELRQLNGKLMRLIESQIQVEVTQNSTRTKNSLSSNSTTNASIERVRRSMSDHEAKIQLLIEKDTNSKKQLKEIEARAKNRLDRADRRERREQARIGYSTTGEELLETLSTKNQALLNQSIKKQEEALGLKCSNLVQEAEQLNYPIFLDELEQHLNEGSSQLSPQATRALHASLKLMRKHIEFEHDYVNAISSLNRKKQTISLLKNKQFELSGRLKGLRNANPKLTSSNQELKIKNVELKAAFESNSAWRQKLVMPSLLLAGLTFLSVIPMILTLSGVIPFFISPALLYALVITPPASLLLATLITGIATIVFIVKANANESALKANMQLIESNTSQMSRNSQNLNAIEATTLPNLESQIKREEGLRDQLLNSLNSSKSQADQALKQASEIEFVSFSNSPFLSKRKDESKTKSESVSAETTEQSDVEDEEETEQATLDV
ncbi:Dot/Icm T4SS effector LegC3/PpeA [Legionella waltersii]|uniref:Kinectin 1 n=1 Tax=Legionella waltersii TaxID=66969 RepID=A0A0W1ALM1_9GAMM|nr:Dot/Icm T4SS effector LegC3/PpeA [Legionella waltersii]KTD82231.1 kinectin 1 [Legionella waltersii]SNV04606.1 kinectin 1 [Legionella waltersii]